MYSTNYLKNFKTISSLIFIFLISGCQSNPSADNSKEAFINVNRGAVYMLLADYDVYKNATKSELTPTTEALLYSTIKKIALIKGFEGKIGGDYKVDKDLNIAEKNQFCWIGNFVQQYKKYIPAQIDKSDVLNWVDKKQMDIKAELRDLNGDKMIENDCRAIN